MGRYIWQSSGWPNITWRSEELLVALGKARQAQGELVAQAKYLGLEGQAEILIDEAVTTAAIEGETLGACRANRPGVPPVLARKLAAGGWRDCIGPVRQPRARMRLHSTAVPSGVAMQAGG